MDAPIELSSGQFVFVPTANKETTNTEQTTKNKENKTEETVQISQDSYAVEEEQKDLIKIWKIENELDENLNPDEIVAGLLIKNNKYIITKLKSL